MNGVREESFQGGAGVVKIKLGDLWKLWVVEAEERMWKILNSCKQTAGLMLTCPRKK